MSVTNTERQYLRELARRYLDLAQQPVMAEREKLWHAHNALRGFRPMIVVETGAFTPELMPPLRCTSDLAKGIEWNLLSTIANHERVGDDKVISHWYSVGWQIHLREFDLEFRNEHAADAQGRTLGFAMKYPLTDIERELPGLKHSVYHVDRDATAADRDAVAEVIGDILPVQITNYSLIWYAAPSYKVVRLMGMEAMLIAMATQPEVMRALFAFVRDDILTFMQWQEREGLLTLNNGNHYVGSGSYGFTTELPKSKDGHVGLKDLWLNMNSQETVGISPEMYADLVFPSYHDIAPHAGLVYYGCCEPVDTIWADCLSRLPNLRKVSVSAWCDEDRIGEYLRGSRVIYSRKPSPNYLGVGTFDEAGFTAHIEETLRAAKGCRLEFIFRDVYTLCGDPEKPSRAVAIIRRLIERLW
jgi:hypothetical protein